MYRSKVIQNQLIEIIGEQLFEKILVEARKAPLFSILGDEVADVSNEELLSLVIRSVNSLNEICEEFLEFVNCSRETTDEALTTIILSKLQSYNLRPKRQNLF